MKTTVLGIFLLIATAVFGQKSEMQLPVRDGKIVKGTEPASLHLSKIDGVIITSKNDSCFSTEDGIVTTTFNLQGEYAAIIKTLDNRFVTYSNLAKITISRNSAVKKGTFIGLLKFEEEIKGFGLRYMLLDKQGKMLAHEKHVSYLESNSSR